MVIEQQVECKQIKAVMLHPMRKCKRVRRAYLRFYFADKIHEKTDTSTTPNI